MDECIFVNPKGARAVQRGASYEFSVRLRRLPEDPSRYFVTLFPLLDVCPWMGPEAWVIPGPELVRGADRSKPRIVRLPVEPRSEEHTSELQSHVNLVCRLLLEKKKTNKPTAC